LFSSATATFGHVTDSANFSNFSDMRRKSNVKSNVKVRVTLLFFVTITFCRYFLKKVTRYSLRYLKIVTITSNALLLTRYLTSLVNVGTNKQRPSKQPLFLRLSFPAKDAVNPYGDIHHALFFNNCPPPGGAAWRLCLSAEAGGLALLYRLPALPRRLP